MCTLSEPGRIRARQIANGLEIVEAANLCRPYRPHTHDCYVVGITTGGVQCFDYRGERRHVLPGQAFAIHPGETHDGRPGTEGGYGYHAVYVAPALISESLNGDHPPFVRDVVGDNPGLIRALTALFDLGTETADDFAITGCVTSLADAFLGLSQQRRRRIEASTFTIAHRILNDLRETAASGLAMSELETAYDMDRFKITRIFRRQFGITPHRYQLQQRVAQARRLIADGIPLADSAYAAGFADQSHMTRQFLKMLGMTPGQWRDLTTK